MADSKISALAAVTDVLATDEYVVARAGATKKITAANLLSPDYAFLAAHGWKGWNANPFVFDGTIALTSGTTRYTQIPFLAGDVVTNLVFGCQSTAGTITTIKVGLYDFSGNRLAASANATTTMDTTGFKSLALSSPYTVLASGFVFAALLVVATTPGGVLAMTSIAGKSSPGGTIASMAGTEGAQTDLDATATITANSGAGMFWAWS